MERVEKVVRVTRGLLVFTIIALALTIATFALAYSLNGRFPVSWFCFGCGVVGGFVSLQQRLKALPDEDLDYLASSWVAVVIVPIFGGVFALVLYLLLLSGIVQGHAFPKFFVPEFQSPPVPADLVRFFRFTCPASGPDFAKLGLWSFVAGFSERLVPSFLAGSFGEIGKDE